MAFKDDVVPHAEPAEEARPRNEKAPPISDADLLDDDRIIELTIAPAGRVVGDEYHYDSGGRLVRSGFVIEYSEAELAAGPTTMRITVRGLKELARAALQKAIGDGTSGSDRECR